MIPSAFTYVRPGTLRDAIEALGRPGSRALAGGQSLLPLMRWRLAEPDVLVDLQDLPGLAGVEATGDRLRIGAMTRHVDVLRSGPWDALREAAAQTGDRQVRRLGTIGGSLGHADPAADLPAALLALGASVEIAAAGGVRQMPLEDFLLGPFITALGEGEILTAVELAPPGPSSGSSYRKLRQEASGFALVGVAAVVSLDPYGRCERVGLGITGVGPAPYRAHAAEELLLGTRLAAEDVARAAAQAVQGVDLADDAYASSDYRREMAEVFARRALDAARERALGAGFDQGPAQGPS